MAAYSEVGSVAANCGVVRNCRPIAPLVAALLMFLLAVLPFTNKSNDEKYTLDINGVVHVYPTDTPPTVYPGNFIHVLNPKDPVKVIQAVYERAGYMAVKIRLSDGRKGWVFSGEDIELH